jgi:hypothetical protein
MEAGWFCHHRAAPSKSTAWNADIGATGTASCVTYTPLSLRPPATRQRTARGTGIPEGDISMGIRIPANPILAVNGIDCHQLPCHAALRAVKYFWTSRWLLFGWIPFSTWPTGPLSRFLPSIRGGTLYSVA